MSNVISSILRFILKLFLVAVAAIFAVSLLFALLVMVLVGWLKFLVTGRKPAPVMQFSRFQPFSPQDIWAGRPAADARKQSDIVDVEVREVPEASAARLDQRQP